MREKNQRTISRVSQQRLHPARTCHAVRAGAYPAPSEEIFVISILKVIRFALTAIRRVDRNTTRISTLNDAALNLLL